MTADLMSIFDVLRPAGTAKEAFTPAPALAQATTQAAAAGPGPAPPGAPPGMPPGAPTGAPPPGAGGPPPADPAAAPPGAGPGGPMDPVMQAAVQQMVGQALQQMGVQPGMPGAPGAPGGGGKGGGKIDPMMFHQLVQDVGHLKKMNAGLMELMSEVTGRPIPLADILSAPAGSSAQAVTAPQPAVGPAPDQGGEAAAAAGPGGAGPAPDQGAGVAAQLPALPPVAVKAADGRLTVGTRVGRLPALPGSAEHLEDPGRFAAPVSAARLARLFAVGR